MGGGVVFVSNSIGNAVFALWATLVDGVGAAASQALFFSLSFSSRIFSREKTSTSTAPSREAGRFERN
jgi:hypothetical protein